MTSGPTPAQVAAQVAMLRQRRPEARAIGLHTPGMWLGGSTLQVQGETLPVVYCTSALQISAALVMQPEDGPPLVLLTPLEEGQLSLDVRARLAGRQLYRIDRWQMVRDLFRARDLDPRLAAYPWLAEALLQHIPTAGYPPVASGWLDVETVWTHLLMQHLGLPHGRPDTVTLLQWSLESQNLRRYEALPAEFRAALRQRVADTAGAVGSAMLEALEAGHGALLLPLGLVSEILFAADGRQDLGIAQARARLEPYVAGRMLSSEVGRAWFTAAASVLATLSEASSRDWLECAQRLLADLKATEYSGLSSVLISGFNQRLTRYAAALHGCLRGEVALEQVEERLDAVTCHREATRQAERLERVRMALRLARALGPLSAQRQSASLAQAVAAYVEHGGYVDWARRCLLGGDELAPLGTAFGLLAERVLQVREQHNQQFAALLAAWHKAPRAMESFIPIEQALSRIVARLARVMPVLLLVIDGMNYAVFYELVADLRHRGWVMLTHQPGRPLPPLLSTLPSVTAMARASLLAGTLTRGASGAEKRRFAAHAELLAVSRSPSPPLLFHKGELVDAGATGLAAAVRAALRDEHRRVVGVVLNAVDDHLAKSEQLRLAWAVEQFQLLDALLHEAHLARRALIVLSDHGHVLEADSMHLAGGAAERWRNYEEPLAPTEIVVEGPRVEKVTGTRRVVVPWSETVRYAPKKQGYHGGATPQEVLVPVGVLTTPDSIPEGWEALPDLTPAWWHTATPLAAAPAAPGRTPRQRMLPPETQSSLFAEFAVRSAAEPSAAWIERLLRSPVFAAQRRLAGRRAPDDDLVARFLHICAAHHYRLSPQALAQALGLPEFRLRALLLGLQRLLNVDGYQVVVVDEAAGTIVLHQPLLATQFQLT